MPEASDRFFKEEMNKKKITNVGGLTIPLDEEDVAFLRAQVGSEHFKTFERCIKSYKEFCVNRLTMCEPEKLLLAQGQLQGLNAAINLLKHAATEFDITG